MKEIFELHPGIKPIPIISFFCGAGGLDVGFIKEGFKPVLSIDCNQTAVITYNHNILDRSAIQLDLTNLTYTDLVTRLNEKCEEGIPRGIIGGPPCQGFSIGNIHASPEDQRNKLPKVYADLLKGLNEEYDLDFFVFENVMGIKNKRFENVLNELENLFDEAGFHVFQENLNAIDFGVAQHRCRFFIVGLNKKNFEKEFIFPTGSLGRCTVKAVIGHLPEPVFYDRKLRPVDIPHHPNHWTMRPKSPRFKTGNFSGMRSFRKLDWNRPSQTVAYGNREIHVHPNGKRRLSVLEAMLLQGFTEDFQLMGTLSEQITQVSNAVPPPVARALAGCIRSVMQPEK